MGAWQVQVLVCSWALQLLLFVLTPEHTARLKPGNWSAQRGAKGRMAMIPLVVIFGLLAVGGAAVIYGTLVKNRWGINPCDVSCPQCNTPLPKLRRPRSLRQEMWGGWTCPSCGVAVDKWGRELSGDRGRDSQILGESSPKDEQASQPVQSTFFDRFKGRSPVFWVIVVLVLLLNAWFDYYVPLGVAFDVIAGAVLFTVYIRSRRLRARG